MSTGPIELRSHSERDTRRIGECLAAGLRAADSPRAVVIAIEGELGAGKTRLVGGLAAGLGVDPSAIASPTFVLAAEHRGDQTDLVHIDAWRMRGVDELASLGFDELLARSPCVIAIEWATKIAAALPDERIDVTIETTDTTERTLIIDDRRGPAARAHLAAALSLFSPAIASMQHRCPTCKRDLRGDEATFPFCSARCRMADLGRWFKGEHRLSRPAEADEELSE